MFYKVIFTAILTVTVFHLNKGEDINAAESIDVFQDYVEINGTEFYIDTNVVHRDTAQSYCESLNMTLVTFEYLEKFDCILLWLEENDFSFDWFWSGALKNESSTEWYWEATGNEITDFTWALGQPSLNFLVRSCISFQVKNEGWDNDDCQIHLLGTFCEEIENYE